MKYCLKVTSLLVVCLPFSNAYSSQIDNTPPPAPTAQTATATDCGAVTLTWSSVEDNDSELLEYRIYKFSLLVQRTQGTPRYLNGGLRQSVISDLPANTKLSFSVSAVDVVGNESSRVPFNSVTTPRSTDGLCTDKTPPKAPAPLNITQQDGGCTTAFYTVDPVTPWEEGDKLRLYLNGNPIREYNNNGGLLNSHSGFGLYPQTDNVFRIESIDPSGNVYKSYIATNYQAPNCSDVTQLGRLRVMMLPVIFTEADTPPRPVDELRKLLFGGSGAPVVNANAYFQEVSYGKLLLSEVHPVTNWITLPHDKAHYCTAVPNGWTCPNTYPILQDALAVLGVDISDVDRFVIFASDTSGGYAGGNTVLLNGSQSSDTRVATLVHELAHTFGALHASSWSCPYLKNGFYNNKAPGKDIYDLQFGCEIHRYGDGYSAMGSNLYHYSAYHKRVMGFLNDWEVLLLKYLPPEGTAELTAVELSQSSQPGYKMAVLPLNKSDPSLPPFYHIEYRTKRGFNGPLNDDLQNPSIEGLVIRYFPDRFQGTDGDEYYIATLTPEIVNGHQGVVEFNDPERGAYIRLDSMDGYKALISYKYTR